MPAIDDTEIIQKKMLGAGLMSELDDNEIKMFSEIGEANSSLAK